MLIVIYGDALNEVNNNDYEMSMRKKTLTGVTRRIFSGKHTHTQLKLTLTIS